MKIRPIDMRQVLSALLLLVFLGHLPTGWAYPENYAPFNKNDKPTHPQFKILMEGGKDLGEKTVTSGEITLHRIPLLEPNDKRWELASIIEISFQGKIVGRLNENREYPFIGEIREADLDGNGLKDFAIEVSYMENGIGKDAMIILFQTEAGKFRIIQYDTYEPSADDFIGAGNDGKYGVLVTEMTQLECLDKKFHSFWVYATYKFVNFNLVMDKKSFKGFPRFIQFTDKPNSQPTNRLSQQQKNQYLLTIPLTIKSTAV